MKHVLRRQSVGPLIASFALALATAAPSLAQPEGEPPPPDLTPLGAPIQLDGECASAPTVFVALETTIAVWQGSSGSPGIFARIGPDLDDLGPGGQIVDDEITGEISVAPLPDGFVVAWIRPSVSQTPEAVFQRFGVDLVPDAAEVVVGPASPQATPSLLADANGIVLIAYYGPAGTVLAQRFSSTGVPVTVPIDVDPSVPSDLRQRTRLAGGVNTFLVAWEGAQPAQSPGLWVRSFSWTGVPAGASTRVASLNTPDFDVAWAMGEFLAAVPDGNVWGYRIAGNGTSTAPAGLIAPAISPHHVELTPGAGVLWLTFVETATGLLASRIELPSQTVLYDPVLLVPNPINEGTSYLARGSARPSGDDRLVAAWQLATNFPIPLPCAGAQGIYAQEFGPAPIPNAVDVPTLPAPGLLALALLLAAGGLSLLRR